MIFYTSLPEPWYLSYITYGLWALIGLTGFGLFSRIVPNSVVPYLYLFIWTAFVFWLGLIPMILVLLVFLFLVFLLLRGNMGGKQDTDV